MNKCDLAQIITHFLICPQNARRLVKSEFVEAISWNYPGRKNLGYFYAITHGAKIIWDFDDHNLLKFWIPGAAPLGAPSIDASIPVAERIDILEPHSRHINICSTWNPYPAMGAPRLPSWPRGLPLDDATNEQCSNSELRSATVSRESIAVLQSLSDWQPDADALYQAIMPFPFYFKRREMTTVLVPPYTLTPYNMQATLHFKAGFWALFLPTSLDSELSDIWRSYIGQRLFWEVGLRVGFIGCPLVVQERDIHISLDKASIKEKSVSHRKLINFLRSWRGNDSENTLTGRIKELWHALERNHFIGHKDGRMMHLWLQSLTKFGYQFPQLLSVFPNSVPESSNHKSGKLDSILANIFPHKLQIEQNKYTARKNVLEYDDAVCQLDSITQSLTFWNSDIHFGSILDQPSFLGQLGHKVVIAVKHIHKNPNPFVWKMKGIHRYDRISNVLKKKFHDVEDQNNTIAERWIIDNFEFYKNDSKIATVDAFLCLYQP